jgi:hypothetical protein
LWITNQPDRACWITGQELVVDGGKSISYLKQLEMRKIDFKSNRPRAVAA